MFRLKSPIIIVLIMSIFLLCSAGSAAAFSLDSYRPDYTQEEKSEEYNEPDEFDESDEFDEFDEFDENDIYDETGEAQTGWFLSGNSWYYFDQDGLMHTGWLYSNDNWYFFDYSGKMLTGWQNFDGYWYYFTNSGEMQTSWLYSEDRWYYFDVDGTLLTGWQYIDGVWRYLDPDSGYMVTDCWVLDNEGRACYINEYGEWITGGLSWIGDSISTWDYGRSAINSLFYDPDIDSQASRCILTDQEGNPSGLTVARRLAEEGRIQNYLVFQMGTNTDDDYPDISTTQKINELINIVGNDTKIILVTVYDTNEWCTDWYYGTINDELCELALNNPNIVLADWAAVCDPETDLVDWAHPTAYGAYKYMSLILNALVDNFGPH